MTENNRESYESSRAVVTGKGLNLNLAQLGHLTLGQLKPILADGSGDFQEGLITLIGPIAQLASPETALSYSLLARWVREYSERQGSEPDWTPLFESFKRERTRVEITDETSLRSISSMLWEIHTAQD